MYNRPGSGPSRASASTLCQKCLKRDNYECKAVAQERPYVSRPSRSQMLANPKLVPKLTTDVPQDLLEKKGIADEQLAKKDLERGRKHERDADRTNGAEGSKRRRSPSSSISVSTTSTRSSRSVSPPRRAAASENRRSPLVGNMPKRRRNSGSSAGSYTTSDRDRAPRTESRSTRKRISETSPAPRGRQYMRELANSPHQSRSRSRQDLANHTGEGHVQGHHRDAGRDHNHSTHTGANILSPRERSLSPFSKRVALTKSMRGQR